MDKKILNLENCLSQRLGGGGVLLYIELVRHFFAVFRLFKKWGLISDIGIELLYLSDVELSCQISDEEKIRMTIRQWYRITSAS